MAAELPHGPPGVRAGSQLAGGGQTPSERPQTLPDTFAGYQPSGRRLFWKQRTVNPPIALCK
jgi:hypothetical protein